MSLPVIVIVVILVLTAPFAAYSLYRAVMREKEDTALPPSPDDSKHVGEQQLNDVFSRKVNRIYSLSLAGFSTLFVLLFILISYVNIKPNVQATLLLIIFVLLLIALSKTVSYFWRCPHCGEKIPAKGGRGVLRPKIPESCIHCGTTLRKDESHKTH